MISTQTQVRSYIEGRQQLLIDALVEPNQVESNPTKLSQRIERAQRQSSFESLFRAERASSAHVYNFSNFGGASCTSTLQHVDLALRGQAALIDLKIATLKSRRAFEMLYCLPELAFTRGAQRMKRHMPNFPIKLVLKTFSDAFEQRLVHKRYTALIGGELEGSGAIVSPLDRKVGSYRFTQRDSASQMRSSHACPFHLQPLSRERTSSRGRQVVNDAARRASGGRDA